MVVWGGLQPIVAQVVVDVLTLTGFGYVAWTKPSPTSATVMVAALTLTLTLSGNLTNRWTVNLPMIPLILFQGIRRLSSWKWLSMIIGILSILLIVMSGALSVLFHSVKLAPTINSKFNIGVADVFLPVKIVVDESTSSSETCVVAREPLDHVTVRLLYPTMDPPESLPYLKTETARAFCEETMKYGGPPPLRKFGWILHNWRLTRFEGKHHATPLEGPFPLIFYSHGLGGNAEMYSYQTRALAAQGYVVVVLEHADGSAPVVRRKDGSLQRRDESVIELHLAGKHDEYIRARRAMTKHRADEILGAVDTMVGLNDKNIPELMAVGLDFKGKLNTKEIHYMGHSFGGASVFHAAHRRVPTSVIAHDPATDWIPDETRRSLYDESRMKDSPFNYTHWQVEGDDEEGSASIHDLDMLILWSHEWMSKQWSGSHILKEMHDRGLVGRAGGASRIGVVDGAHHTEFSDTSMMMPLWLARGLGVTGQRNPLTTAQEIHLQTRDFLDDLKRKI